MRVNPYLNFNGDCAEAFKFYEKCLKGKITVMLPVAESPAASQFPPEWGQKILHVTLTVGDEMIQGSDALSPHFDKPQGFAVTIALQDSVEAERIFKALSEGGNVSMPMQETFWAERFAMFVDRFGTPWMINCGKTA
jgi:PhnB protein